MVGEPSSVQQFATSAEFARQQRAVAASNANDQREIRLDVTTLEERCPTGIGPLPALPAESGARLNRLIAPG